MSSVVFITHPEVTVDPRTPVTEWSLSRKGKARMTAFCGHDVISDVTAVWSSKETKAVEGARILADALALVPGVKRCLHENDRSSTGFLEPDEFWATADQFFSKPEVSVRGWERAIDAQRRIISCVESIANSRPESGDIAIVSHGAVGALLMCHLKHLPISRTREQPPGGGGYFFVFNRTSWELRTNWQNIEPPATAEEAFQ